MRSFRQVCMLLPAAVLTAAQAAVPTPPAEPQNTPAPLVKAEGDTPLLQLCRAAATANAEARPPLQQSIEELLRKGADALSENSEGCNALFYLCALPDFKKELEGKKLLPRELALRIPHDDAQLQRYMKLRLAQAELCPAEGSRDYLVRRYCAPAFGRAQARLAAYLAAGSLYRIPQDGMKTTLSFMLLADDQKARAYVNDLILWQHGEHFLEEIPAAFLQDLYTLNWHVNPGKLRLALQKLNSMLPKTQEDMIDCYASVPMARLLELLVSHERANALPDLKQYAKSYDPDLVQACLRLQLKLNNITPPDELPEPPADAEQAAMREALLADAALHRGSLDGLTPATLQHAAAYLQQKGLTQHAEIISGLLEDGEIIVTDSSMPAVRALYEDLQEQRPRVVLLKRLLEQQPPTPAAP